MSGILSIGAGGDTGFYDFPLDQALRFNDDDSSYLQRTPSSTGNRTTWTWSCWIKRSNISYSSANMFGAYSGSNDFEYIRFDSDDCIRYTYYVSGSVGNLLKTSASFRDTSAWYHILVQRSGSSSEIYVNGVQQDLQTETRASSNGYLNHTVAHDIGRFGGTSQHFDGYMAEMNFVDGTSLNPTSFGETKNGIWIPKQYTGSYGTNGFRLTFEDDTTVEGFNTVTYSGPIGASAAAGTTGTVSGVGFQPDLVWIKNRTNANNHQWFDSVRGTDSSGDQAIISNDTAVESTSNTNGGLISLDSDGFTLKAGTDSGSGRSNNTGSDAYNYVAWCWDAGGAPTADNSAGAGNTPTANSVKIDGANLGSALAGTIPATRLSANTTRGFSIVTYTGTGSAGTIAHGLSAAPTMIIVKKRTNDTQAWQVYHSGNTANPETDKLTFNTDAATVDDDTTWNDTAPTSTVFSVGSGSGTNESGDTYVAYCWTDISGYSKMGSYTGNGSSGHAITTGFAPAWLMVKRRDAVNSWYIVDNTRTVNTAAGNDDLLYANLANAEGSTNDFFTFTSTGFELNTNSPAVNTSNGDYIYMAFADTREYAFWTDQSGNNNDFQHNNLEHTDVVPDRPTNNFATWNTEYADASGINSVTVSEGGLKIAGTSSLFDVTGLSFQLPKSGKWYFEYTIGGQYDGWGFCKVGEEGDITAGNGLGNLGTSQGGGIQQQGWRNGASVTTNFGSTFTAGDIHQVAIDVDGGKLYYGINNTYYAADGDGDGNPSAGTNHLSTFDFAGNDITLMAQVTTDSSAENWNFGQNGSFNDTKVEQGNSDASGIGNFYYSPPTNFLALCTDNLPDPAVDPNKGETPEDHFNTVTYTGTGASTLSITGVGFQPDWVWAKKRSATDHHALSDVIRGVTKTLSTSQSTAETTDANGLQSFDADGFTVGSGSGSGVWGGNSGATYVAWNWKAGGTAVSNDDGDVTSSVSANAAAGFSIVTYTATGSGDITVGHGLGVAPELILGKVRNQAYGWTNFALPAGSGAVVGFGTNAPASGSGNVAYGKTAPTSSVFTAGRGSTDNMNYGSGDTVVAYCFASIEGHSKIGNYTGNGSSDGTFVYTGFRPAWVMLKRINTTGSWKIFDNKRPAPYNVIDARIEADNSGAESTSSSYSIDLISNGFKLRGTSAEQNGSGSTFFYLAIAEQPFKYANAR